MDINDKLKEAGLTGNESKVYLELLKKKELSANEIARSISMDRTLAYTVLNHLIEKGHVSYVIKKGKKTFSCSDPESLLNQIMAKEVMVIDLIKDLKKIKTEKQEKFEINVYEGKEGIRTVIRLMLSVGELNVFGSTGRAFFHLYEMPAIAKAVGKNKIPVKIIGHREHKEKEPFKLEGFEYRFLDVEAEATTSIFGDYVGIHLIKGKPIMIVIKNKDIAQSYKNYFDYMWKKAGKAT
ncbi:MAG: helix-turn-helix domain-containing protein [archaeon]